MGKEEESRHVQLPNDMSGGGLDPWDMLVYLSIRSFINKDGKAYPSLRKISKVSGLCVDRVRECIGNLEKEDYIVVERNGKGSLYRFNEYKAFEPFSYDFLENEDLTVNEKAYIVATQQYMFKDKEGVGRIMYPNTKLAKMINVSEGMIRKCDKSLVAKGYLARIENGKEFNLAKIGQMIVWVLKNHEDRITENTESINEIKEDNKRMSDEIEMLKEEIRKLKGSGKEFVM